MRARTNSLGILGLLVLGGFATGASQPARVLDRLETYEAPAFPANAASTGEAYDFRKRDGISVPSKPMALVVDVCVTIRHDIDDTFKPQLASASEVSGAFKLYLTRDWKEIPGLRPWTNWNFVRSLTKPDQARLADEVAAVLKSGRLTAEECRYGR